MLHRFAGSAFDGERHELLHPDEEKTLPLGGAERMLLAPDRRRAEWPSWPPRYR